MYVAGGGLRNDQPARDRWGDPIWLDFIGLRGISGSRSNTVSKTWTTTVGELCAYQWNRIVRIDMGVTAGVG